MLTMDALRAYGANVDEGMGRCLNNEGFYFRLIGMALDDPGFGKLRQAVEAGDTRAAFEAAHALKGVLGNLALTPLYVPVSEMTELLRANAEADYAAYLQTIEQQRAALLALKG